MENHIFFKFHLNILINQFANETKIPLSYLKNFLNSQYQKAQYQVFRLFMFRQLIHLTIN